MLEKHPPLIRVAVIDDSPTVRDLLTIILQEAGGIQVVGSGGNGEDAVRLAARLRPDVITMDVRMPKLDGLEATRRIMRDNPTRIVIVTGSLMRDEVDLTFEALQAGALTVLTKPGLADPETCDKIVQTVRLMSGVPVIHHWGRGRPLPPARPAGEGKPQLITPIRPAPQSDVCIIGVATSTGGPAALATLLRDLPPDFPLPILVVQHITQGFAVGLAEWLGTQTSLRVGLAGHGESLSPGVVLLAPDDYHIQVSRPGTVELSKAPPYKGLRPSANQLFSSLARSYGARALGVILTGMGDDGADGLKELCAAGGLTIAQVEQSCVVYGMPREALAQGAVERVLPLDQIATALRQVASLAQAEEVERC